MNYKDFFKRKMTSGALPGGKGDETPPDDVDKTQLAMGIKVEMEHTGDETIAREIAMDHLTEDPKYYTKLYGSGLADELNKKDDGGLPKRDGALDIPHLGQPIHMAKIVQVGSLGAKAPASGELSGYTNVDKSPGTKVTAAGTVDPGIASKSVGGPVSPNAGQKQGGPNTKGCIADTPKNPKLEGGMDIPGGKKGNIQGDVDGTPKNTEIDGACAGAPPAEDVVIDLMESKKAHSILREIIEECMSELCYNEETGLYEECGDMDEVAPPGFGPDKEHADIYNKLKAQYPGEPAKAYATMWKIHNKIAEGSLVLEEGKKGKKKWVKKDDKKSGGKKAVSAKQQAFFDKIGVGKKKDKKLDESGWERRNPDQPELDPLGLVNRPIKGGTRNYGPPPTPKPPKKDDKKKDEPKVDEASYKVAPKMSARCQKCDHARKVQTDPHMTEIGDETNKTDSDIATLDPVAGATVNVKSEGHKGQKGYKLWVCERCGLEMIRQMSAHGRPDPVTWRDGHTCRFVEQPNTATPTSGAGKLQEQSYKVGARSYRTFQDSPQLTQHHDPEVDESTQVNEKVMSYTPFRQGNKVWHYDSAGRYVVGEPNRHDRGKAAPVSAQDPGDVNKKRKWWKTEAVGGQPQLDPKKIFDIEIDGLDRSDYPDFSDAYISKAVYPAVPNPRDGHPEDWRELTEDELDWVNDNLRDLVYQHAYDQFVNYDPTEAARLEEEHKKVKAIIKSIVNEVLKK